MKPAPFDYTSAANVAEAITLLAQHGGDARLLAGGQSLVPMMNLRMARPAVLIDINRIAALGGWRIEGGRLRIGALTRQRVLEHDTTLAGHAPLLRQAVRHIGHVATRNRGTIGGSLAHADPSAELPICALALDARLHARSQRGVREIAAEDFFRGVLTTALAEDELLEALTFELSPPATGFSFLEIARRPGDFAMVAVACRVTLGDGGQIAALRLALGGVGPRPERAHSAEAAVTGQLPSAELWRLAGRAANQALAPNSDLHATAQYRTDVAAVLVARALAEAAGHAATVLPGKDKS